MTAERDQYLDASRRLQAEFENYRKAVAKREVEAQERANESLVSEILPVLDACDGALATGRSTWSRCGPPSSTPWSSRDSTVSTTPSRRSTPNAMTR